jgi:hypothetical protein
MISEEMGNTKFLLENLMRIDHLRGLSVGGRIILNWILRKKYGNHGRVTLAQDRDQWVSCHELRDAGNLLTS